MQKFDMLSLARSCILLVFSTFFSEAATAGALHDAARVGDTAKIVELFESGVNIEEKDSAGLTPLLITVLSDQFGAFSKLIEYGADPGGRSARGFTPLHAAAHTGRYEIASLLIEMGADINDRDNAEMVGPLHLASEGGFAELVIALIEAGADINVKAADGKNPLTMATLKNRPEVIRILVNHGADCTKIRSKRFRKTCLDAGS